MIFNSTVNRPAPSLSPEYFKSYEVSRPRATHFRKATCQEVDCPNYARGWRTAVDVSTTLGQSQANYIRLKSGRSFTTEVSGDIVIFTFPAGQRCFSQHTVPLEREPLFRVLGGDWRGNPSRTPAQILRPQAWLDHFGEHQQRLAEQRQKG